jgi:hypothetical protein
MGLMVNEGKTKYMILSLKNNNQQSLVVNGMLFERVNTFKYLGVELRADGNIHKEIKKKKINTANRCLFALKPIFNSKFVSFKIKTILYKVINYTSNCFIRE